jgi:hypothetical protein
MFLSGAGLRPQTSWSPLTQLGLQGWATTPSQDVLICTVGLLNYTNHYTHHFTNISFLEIQTFKTYLLAIVRHSWLLSTVTMQETIYTAFGDQPPPGWPLCDLTNYYCLLSTSPIYHLQMHLFLYLSINHVSVICHICLSSVCLDVFYYLHIIYLYLSIHPSLIYIDISSLHLSTYPSIYYLLSFTYHLSIYLLSTYPSIHLSVYLSIYLSVFVYLSPFVLPKTLRGRY